MMVEATPHTDNQETGEDVNHSYLAIGVRVAGLKAVIGGGGRSTDGSNPTGNRHIPKVK